VRGINLKEKIMNKETSTPETHDPFGPSTHPTLVLCPAYKGSSGDSIHSVLGTLKHDLVYKLQTGAMTRKDVENIRTFDFGDQECPFTSDDMNEVFIASDATDMFLDKIRELECEEFEILREESIDLTVLGITHGTGDLCIVGENFFAVMDYKFGQVQVSPYSEQLKSYACGLVDSYPLNESERGYLCIIQPKVNPTPYMVKISMEQLLKHQEMITDVIEVAKSGHAPRVLNKNCQYCSRFSRCSVAISGMQKASTEVGFLEGGSIESMTNEEVGFMLTKLMGVEKIIGKIKQVVFARLSAGAEIDGFELKNGRSSRVWTDERDAVEILNELCEENELDKSKLYETKFISPAKAEKLLSKKALKDQIQKYILKKQGKPTLAITKEVK
jgi:hypothetical protein